MFHVNQKRRGLLADAELGEDRAKHLLDIDAAGEPAEMVRGDPQFLRLELGSGRAIAVTRERGLRRFELNPVAGACQDRSPSPLPRTDRRLLGQHVNELLDALAGLGRNPQRVVARSLAGREIDLVQDRDRYLTTLARTLRCNSSWRVPLRRGRIDDPENEVRVPCPRQGAPDAFGLDLALGLAQARRAEHPV